MVSVVLFILCVLSCDKERKARLLVMAERNLYDVLVFCYPSKLGNVPGLTFRV